MRRRDLLALAAWAALVAVLLAPALARPGAVPAHFGDLFSYHHPLRHAAASALQEGRLPFWNPYIFGGLPLLANSQSAVFYPVSLLGFVLPLASALSWDLAFHLFWAGTGLFLLARRQGLSTWGASLLGVLFSLSPFLVYRIAEGIPTLLASLSWVPWCWLAWSSRRPPLLAAVWALQFLSGHPQFLLANALGMGLWALARPRRELPLLAGGAAGALGLACVQWPATAEFLGRSVRTSWPREFMLGYSLEPGRLLTWLFPNAWGNPLDGSFAGPPSVFFENCAGFIGISGLLLAAYGLARGRRLPLVLAGAGLFLALGGNNPAYRWLLASGLGLMRTPSRWAFLLLWALVLAAGAGARRLSAARAAGRGWRAALLGAVLLELLAWDARFLGAQGTEALAPRPGLARAAGGKPLRVLTDPELANPNKAMLYRARNANGYEAFFLEGFAELAARSEGGPAVDASRSYLRRADTEEMARFGVAWTVRRDGSLQPALAPLPLAYFVDPAGRPVGRPPELELAGPERWRVAGLVPSGAARLVLSEAHYPGWRAWWNGEPSPLRRQEGFFRSLPRPVEVLSGEPFVADLRFSPTLWPLWAGLCSLAWGAWLVRLSSAARRLA